MTPSSVPWRPAWGTIDVMKTGNCSHAVQFFGCDEGHLVKSVCRFLGEGISRGESGLCIATPQRRNAIRRQLIAEGVALGEGVEDSNDPQVIFADAQTTLAQFVVNGTPDP